MKTEERKYKLFWLIFWIIVCFPVAYYYYFKKQYPTKEILKEKKSKYIFMGLVVLYVATSGIGIMTGDLQESLTNPLYTDDVLYDCQKGDYSFSENEPIFKGLYLSVIDWEKLKDNECVLSLDYKIHVKPDLENPYYEIDYDMCKLTMSQLSYFKEKNANLMTMLKDASCDFGTILLLEKAIKPLDFKGQVKETLSNLGASHSEFLASFDEWTSGVISYEDFQEATKNEKITASKAFKDLQDLQPQPEDAELQTKAVKAVELYLDSLNSLEDALSKQSQPDFEASMEKSTTQMGEATTKVMEVVELLDKE